MSQPPRFFAFWALNDALNLSRLRWQLEQFRKAGLDGVVFHPRFHPGNPPHLGEKYLSLLTKAILYAKTLGLAVWIHGEDGRSGGTVVGQLLHRHPEFARHWAGLHRERPIDVLHDFKAKGTRWYVGLHPGPGVDYLNPGLAPEYLALTGERYRTGLSEEAFAHVEAFSCDTAGFGPGGADENLPPEGAVPWTADLPAAYQERYGVALQQDLPSVFLDEANAGEARVRFWEWLHDRFCHAFLEPLDDWCRSHGKRCTVRVGNAEHPLSQVPMVGSCHGVFERIGLPGIDAPGRYPTRDYPARQAAAVSRQFGNGRCMVGAFAGAGWGAAPGDLERHLVWLGNNGLTDFVLHLSHYRLKSDAIRHQPASLPLDVTWNEAFPRVLARVRERLGLRPLAPPETLVVSPHRGIMQRFTPRELPRNHDHRAETYPSSTASRINNRFMELVAAAGNAGLAVDFADERTLEAHGRLTSGGLQVGRAVYSRVVLSPDASLNAGGQVLLRQARTGGVEVLDRPPAVPSQPAGTRAVEDEPDTRVSCHPAWSRVHLPANVLVLEPRPVSTGAFRCEFACADDLAGRASLWLLSADAVRSWRCNGHKGLPAGKMGPLHVARIPPELVQRWNTLELDLAAGLTPPMVWIQGAFRLLPAAPPSPGPSGCARVDGPFELAAAIPLDVSCDLGAQGYYFFRESVEAEGEFDLPSPVSELSLTRVAADCAEVTIDELSPIWCWGPDWSLLLPTELPSGRHAIGIRLVPSSYNFFGPHHHPAGDEPMAGPARFGGSGDFADPPDAPAPTQIAGWHFKPVFLPEFIVPRSEPQGGEAAREALARQAGEGGEMLPTGRTGMPASEE